MPRQTCASIVLIGWLQGEGELKVFAALRARLPHWRGAEHVLVCGDSDAVIMALMLPLDASVSISLGPMHGYLSANDLRLWYFQCLANAWKRSSGGMCGQFGTRKGTEDGTSGLPWELDTRGGGGLSIERWLESERRQFHLSLLKVRLHSMNTSSHV
jgi:hypothetical protein